jgi:hypothetical protein
LSPTDHWLLKPGVLRASPWRRALGALFSIAFGGVFLWFMLPEIVANLAAARWSEGSCTIVTSAAGTQAPTEPAGETLYRVFVRFTYQVGGRSYESTRYRFVNPFVNDQAKVEAAARAYPVGATVPCFIDPNDATQAVLDRKHSPFALAALLPAAFVALGTWSLAWVGLDVVRGRA